MSRFKFVMEDGIEFQILAKNLESAWTVFAQFFADPSKINCIEERACSKAR